MNLLDKIDEMRKDRGLSRRQLALKSGLDPATIMRWKESTPGYANLEKVARVLDVPVEVLMEGVQTDAQPTPYYLNDETKEIANAVYANSKLRLLFDNSRKMKPEDLNVLIAMQEAILRKENND